MNIVKAKVGVDFYGPDYIYLYTDLPSTMPEVTKENLIAKVTAASGTGIQYVRDHFGIEPEVFGQRIRENNRLIKFGDPPNGNSTKRAKN